MKRFLQHIVHFIGFTLLGYIVLICFWGELATDSFKKNLHYKIGYYGHMFSRINDIQDEKDVDILFLGSSHVYRGLDPRIFETYGFKAFNLGSSAQTPIQTQLLLHRYLEVLNPDIIIYDIYPESFDSDGVESALDIISNSNNDFESIKMALKVNHIKVYNTLIYGFYRDIFKRNNHFVEHLRKGTDTYIKNGFVEKDLTYNDHKYLGSISWNFKDRQSKAFQKIIELLSTKNIPYYLIQIPVTNSRYKAYNHKDEFDEFLRQYGEYYNFNRLIQLNDSLDFYDTQHLNRNGVALFDTFLINTLFIE